MLQKWTDVSKVLTASIIRAISISQKIIVVIKYCSGDEIYVDELGKTCITHGEIRNVYRNLIGIQKERVCCEYLDVYGSVILKWIKKWDSGVWSGLVWFRTATSDGPVG
jgi:hypothetical protein